MKSMIASLCVAALFGCSKAPADKQNAAKDDVAELVSSSSSEAQAKKGLDTVFGNLKSSKVISQAEYEAQQKQKKLEQQNQK